MAFGDRNIKLVNKFVYLRALVIPKNNVGLKIQQRIETANRCFCGLLNSYLSTQPKCHLRREEQ
jgi:hypothetical protein